MKKMLFFSILFFCAGVIGAAQAGCQLLSCGSFSWYEPNGRIQAGVNSDQCWGCGIGPKSCGNNDVVPYVDEYSEIISLHQCSFGFTNGFESYNPGNFCTDSPIQNGNTAHAKIIYKPVGQKTRQTNVGDVEFFNGSSFCKYIYCLDGYMPDSDNVKTAKCVLDNRQNQCETSGGSWNGTACTCNSSKNLKLKSDGKACECISADYEPDGVNGCKKKQSVIDDEQRQRNQQRAQACKSSGGTWRNNQCVCDKDKNLKTQNYTCVCLDETYYKRVGDRCELTDAAALQRECETESSRASGAYWDALNKSCLCKDPQNVWIDKICKQNPAIAECQKIYGAAWNNADRACYCTDPDKEMNASGTACVESSAARERRESASAELTITKSRNKIKETSKKLMSMAEDFDRTVWKTEEGKFNSTRLLSDSVAGVVLGTAGGLITSNVIKKNQVSNGFEDIQCTVGGQVVSGWGDEFRVGIQ